MTAIISQVALVLKNLPANAEDLKKAGSILGSGRSLEEDMATHFSILAWRIPWTEEPGRRKSIGLQRVGHDWSDLAWHNIAAIMVVQEEDSKKIQPESI